MASLFGLDPAAYRPHDVHTGARAYSETNCYTDIVIELLHARGDEPLAMLGTTVRTDFEGDQWTFFKPAPHDLEALYGVDIHEMQPYRPLPQQIEEQIRAGRTLITELDSWYLPDTQATAYRREHVKTSVVAEAIDRDGERLRYFHNLTLHELEGEDYRGVFRLGREFSDDVLPPYTELVRFDAGPRLTGDALRASSAELLRGHLDRRPSANPFTAFGVQLGEALPGLLEGDAALYHEYAFATVRMVGSAFELCASHVEWLLGQQAEPIVAPLGTIVDGSKTLSFKLARRRAFDPEPALSALAAAWDEALTRLDAAVR
ncbi:MAG: hypothetical protein QOJ12_1900 [Thermoleophilales bacterium]|jgi:hypothetical protein|nr:hypothetical protein [Thermoleophilales bacterium]